MPRKGKRGKRLLTLKYLDEIFVSENELKLEIVRLMEYIDTRFKELNSPGETTTITEARYNADEVAFKESLMEVQLETNDTQDNNPEVQTEDSIVDATLKFLGIKD